MMLWAWLLACRPEPTPSTTPAGETAETADTATAMPTGETGTPTSATGDTGAPLGLVLEQTVPVFPEQAADNQHHATVTAADDRILVVWDHGSVPTARTGARVYDLQGQPLIDTQMIANAGDEAPSRPTAERFDDGFVVVTNTTWDVWLQQLDDLGRPVGEAQQLNATRGTRADRGYPDVSTLGDGVAVLWEHESPPGADYALLALDDQLQTTADSSWSVPYDGGAPALATDADGFVWSAHTDGDPLTMTGHLYLSRHDASLDAVVGPIDVPLGTHVWAGRPIVAAGEDGVAVAFNGVDGATVAVLDLQGQLRYHLPLGPAAKNGVVEWGDDVLWVAWQDLAAERIRVLGHDPLTGDPVSEQVELEPTSTRPSLAVVGDQVVVSYNIHSAVPGGDDDVVLAWLRWCAGC